MSDTTTLAELAAVKGQLSQITSMLQAQHASTNTRIDDLRKSIEGRFDSAEKRIGRLEDNERGTAIKTAGISAFSGAVTAALLHLLRIKG